MVGAVLGMRLRAASAAVVGVLAPRELPCREPGGCSLLCAPVGVRSPSAMVVVAGWAGAENVAALKPWANRPPGRCGDALVKDVLFTRRRWFQPLRGSYVQERTKQT